MRTNTLLFLLGVCGACFYAKNAQAGAEPMQFSSRPSESRASVMTTEDAINMLQKYGIIDEFASGELVTSMTSSLGKKYEQNPIKAISKDLLYHFMMYQDGVEEIRDYPYIDTIIELYRRANTEQEELQAQGLARLSDDMDALNREVGKALLGETSPQNKVKTLKRLPVRCLEAFAAEGCAVKDYNACYANVVQVKPMDEKILAFLCTKGIANAPHLLNFKSYAGRTPLMLAASFSTAEACKALIEAGADVNAKDNAGWTPLIFAARYSTAEACKALIEAGADVNAKDNGGWTPLIFAARYSTAEACKALIEAGADVNAKNNYGSTLLMIAAGNPSGETIKIFIAGADVNAKDNYGWTPLIFAARSSTAEACKALIDAGADVNAKDNDGWTPLMYAARSSTAEACKALIDAGADVNAKDNDGWTPLDYASVVGNDDTVDLLLQNGAKAHVRDDVYSDIRKATFLTPVKEQLIKNFPNGKHKYQEVLNLLNKK